MLFNLVKVVDRANSLAFFYKSLILAGIILPFAAISGQASPNYQERDGIYGEIKFAEFCNTPGALRYRIIAEAGSRDTQVMNVDFNMYTRYSISLNLLGQEFGLPSGENWRRFKREMNQLGGRDRRFYDTGVLFTPLGSITDSPVKFSIHVNHRRGRTIDLGGIVDMGRIERGKCRIYDDGNFR